MACFSGNTSTGCRRSRIFLFFGSTITLWMLVAVVEVMLAEVVEVPLEPPFLFRLDVGGSVKWWLFSSWLPANGGSKVLLISFAFENCWLHGGFAALITTGLAFKWTEMTGPLFLSGFTLTLWVLLAMMDVMFAGGRCSSRGSLNFQIRLEGPRQMIACQRGSSVSFSVYTRTSLVKWWLHRIDRSRTHLGMNKYRILEPKYLHWLS